MLNLAEDVVSMNHPQHQRVAMGNRLRGMVEVRSSEPVGASVVPVSAPARLRLMGMPISVVTEKQAIDYIFNGIACKRGGWVITPNLDQLRLNGTRPEVRSMYEQADLSLADGMPLIWASRLMMKRWTRWQLRPNRQPTDHQHVYVALFNPAVGKIRTVRAAKSGAIGGSQEGLRYLRRGRLAQAQPASWPLRRDGGLATLCARICI